MRYMVTTAMVISLSLSLPAQALAPESSLEKTLALMDKEQAIEYAIATITTDKKEAKCAKKIAYKESRYNINSYNKSSGATGVWQLLWAKPEWSILKQTKEAHKYVLHRYSSWCLAYRFHQERNWY